ncbi:hypothetical protein E4U16_003166 [Claviceps sp. LM84 group G4]|nr:hypothetical protein E4U16_003166 [Claviceps sp. LM84 group G4]
MSDKAFKFLIGPEKRPFIIHSELVASLSPVLERLVKGELKEAQEGSVAWEHVDVQTFIRFSQYAYTRTYEYPAFRPRPQPKDRAIVESCPRSKTAMHHLRTWARESFVVQLSSFSNQTYMVMERASPLAEGQNNDAELLLSHARLYVLADCYGIAPLMSLSLTTLHHVLLEIPEWDDVADMFIKLLHYCYENDTPAALRELVVEYAVCQVDNLWHRDEIKNFAQTHGEFSSAVIESMVMSLDLCV